jgi:hypothetical protein
MITHAQSGSFREQIREHPILLAFGAVWALEAGMNAIYGYRRGGGGIGALGYAAVFLAIAFIAAWLPTRLAHVHRDDPLLMGKRFALIVLTALCFLMSQMAGNAVVGVTMADGAAKRDQDATNHSTAKEKLDRYRVESKVLGTQPAPDQVQARIDAELATVVRRAGQTVGEISNNCADASAAPAPCQRVAKAKTELASAKRKAELDALIDKASGSFNHTETVAEGSPETQVIARLTGYADDDVRFWWNVALVFMIGLFANFGFAIAGFGRPDAAAPHAAAGWADGGTGHWPPPPAYPMLPPPSAPSAQQQPQQHSGFPGSRQDIHLHLAAAGAGSPPSSAAAPAPQPHGPSPSARVPAEAHPKSSPMAHSPSTPAPGSPVDRNPLREKLDDMLTFRAFALMDQQGAAIGADDLYRRYASWAGPKAVADGAFHTLFSAATNVRSMALGGMAHYQDVAFRPAQLKAVA